MNISLTGTYPRLLQYLIPALGLLLLLCGSNLQAAEQLPEIDPHLIKLHTVEPERDAGYTVGDLLTRTITLTVIKPYHLLDTSLPIVGYEKRYRGKVSGIELRDIQKQQRETTDSTIYTIKLTYQVFTRNVVAKPSALPAETVKIQGEQGIYNYRIPSWNFRISPIAVFGEVKLESDMSPFRGPIFEQDQYERLALKVALGGLLLSALGLLYILGAHAWLPRMGGPFSRACRQLKKSRKLPLDGTTMRAELNNVHQAFNRTLGVSVFTSNLEQFLQKKPLFSVIRPEVEQFFQLSRQLFFEQTPSQQDMEEQRLWLYRFARHCRDCERGLRPGKSS